MAAAGFAYCAPLLQTPGQRPSAVWVVVLLINIVLGKRQVADVRVYSARLTLLTQAVT